MLTDKDKRAIYDEDGTVDEEDTIFDQVNILLEYILVVYTIIVNSVWSQSHSHTLRLYSLVTVSFPYPQVIQSGHILIPIPHRIETGPTTGDFSSPK